MKQNKLLKELVLDYTKVCDEMAQMQINKEKMEEVNKEKMDEVHKVDEDRGMLLLKTKVLPFFSAYKKLLTTSLNELAKRSPLSLCTFQKLVNGENLELYSLVLGAHIMFYSKGYEFRLENVFKWIEMIKRKDNCMEFRVVTRSELASIDPSLHLYVPITADSVSPFYPNEMLSDEKKEVLRKYSMRSVGVLLGTHLGPHASKYHDLVDQTAYQLEEYVDASHATFCKLHKGYNVYMNKYLTVFEAYYEAAGMELSYKRLSNAILEATMCGGGVVALPLSFFAAKK